MTNDELLAIRTLMREEITSSEKRIMESVGEQIKAAQTETMQGAAVLLESQFMGHFNLLLEKMDDVLRKIPSDEDMDIIDDRLDEHDGEIKVLRHDVNELKRAQ